MVFAGVACASRSYTERLQTTILQVFEILQIRHSRNLEKMIKFVYSVHKRRSLRWWCSSAKIFFALRATWSIEYIYSKYTAKQFSALRAAWSPEYIYSEYTVELFSALRAAWSTECLPQTSPLPLSRMARGVLKTDQKPVGDPNTRGDQK